MWLSPHFALAKTPRTPRGVLAGMARSYRTTIPVGARPACEMFVSNFFLRVLSVLARAYLINAEKITTTKPCPLYLSMNTFTGDPARHTNTHTHL